MCNLHCLFIFLSQQLLRQQPIAVLTQQQYALAAQQQQLGRFHRHANLDAFFAGRPLTCKAVAFLQNQGKHLFSTNVLMICVLSTRPKTPIIAGWVCRVYAPGLLSDNRIHSLQDEPLFFHFLPQKYPSLPFGMGNRLDAVFGTSCKFVDLN